MDPGLFFKRGACLNKSFLFVAGRHVGKWGRNKIAHKEACPKMCPLVARRCARRWPEVPKQSLPKEPMQELPEDAPEGAPEGAPEVAPEVAPEGVQRARDWFLKDPLLKRRLLFGTS